MRVHVCVHVDGYEYVAVHVHMYMDGYVSTCKCKDVRELVNGKRVRDDLWSVGMLGFGESLIALNEGREFQ